MRSYLEEIQQSSMVFLISLQQAIRRKMMPSSAQFYHQLVVQTLVDQDRKLFSLLSFFFAFQAEQF